MNGFTKERQESRKIHQERKRRASYTKINSIGQSASSCIREGGEASKAQLIKK